MTKDEFDRGVKEGIRQQRELLVRLIAEGKVALRIMRQGPEVMEDLRQQLLGEEAGHDG